MKLLNRFLGLIVLAVMIAGGLFLMAAALSGGLWEQTLATVSSRRIVVLGIGTVMALLGLLYLLSGVKRRKGKHVLSFDREGGTVSISSDAIVDYIAKLSAEFPSVVRMKPRVVPARNAVDIVVEIHVRAGPQIHELCELLQRRVRESMTNGLGIAEVRKVEVRVTQIVSEHKPA